MYVSQTVIENATAMYLVSLALLYILFLGLSLRTSTGIVSEIEKATWSVCLVMATTFFVAAALKIFANIF